MSKTPSEHGTLFECNQWVSKMLELNRIKSPKMINSGNELKQKDNKIAKREKHRAA